MSLIDEIRADRGAGMDPKHGEWIWHGQPDHLSLATAYGGRRYVMDFVRKGMRGAQPRFQVGGIMCSASDDLATFSVGDGNVRGDKMARMNASVYRYDVSGIDHPDARRIARVPDMESALLAAEELASIATRTLSEYPDPRLNEAIAAYRNATGAA